MLCSIIWQVLQLEYSLTCFKSYFNKWKKLSIGIDFGIGIDQNSWYRYRYRPKKLVSPITTHDEKVTVVKAPHTISSGIRSTANKKIFL